MDPRPGLLARIMLAIAPRWALRRERARVAVRELRRYDGASTGRRTSGWNRRGSDANAAAAAAKKPLRDMARDLVRNNAWAARALSVIVNNTVGWGITANARGPEAPAAMAGWLPWAGSTECDYDGRLTFAGLQRLVMATVVVSGSALVVRRYVGGVLKIQVLEPDYLDPLHDGVYSDAGGLTVQGVEFDRHGRRVAYWLFDEHPGSATMTGRSFTSRRVPASEVIHVFDVARPGQADGVSWFAPVMVKLADHGDWTDAVLMRQKIASCFAVFVGDIDGTSPTMGKATTDPLIDELEPGMIKYLKPGQSITFATPPAEGGNATLDKAIMQAVAAGMRITYEDQTGDYSQSNFSNARMARISHWANVHDWQWNTIIPQFCEGVWRWKVEDGRRLGMLSDAPIPAMWVPPSMPMIEPDKEGLAYARNVRAGVQTLDEMIMERGNDPAAHLAAIAASNARLDELGIVLDCDPRTTTQSGQAQRPAKPAASESDAALSLSGGQVTSALETIVRAVEAGELPRGSAVTMVQSFFRLSRETADALLSTVVGSH